MRARCSCAQSSARPQVFDAIDADGGGTLDLKELQAGLQRLVDAADRGRQAQQGARHEVGRARQHAQRYFAAATSMEAVEREEERLRALRRPVDARLGELIGVQTKGGAKLKDLHSSWDSTIGPQQPEGRGLTKAQFRSHATASLAGRPPGIVGGRDGAPPPTPEDQTLLGAEIDACFDALLAQMVGGEKKARVAATKAADPRLPMPAALRLCSEAASRRRDEDEKLLASFHELRAKTASLQAALRQEAEVERERAMAAEAAARVEAEAAAVARAAEAAARREAAAKEKAEFENKVAKRRNSLVGAQLITANVAAALAGAKIE